MTNRGQNRDEDGSHAFDTGTYTTAQQSSRNFTARLLQITIMRSYRLLDTTHLHLITAFQNALYTVIQRSSCRFDALMRCLEYHTTPHLGWLLKALLFYLPLLENNNGCLIHSLFFAAAQNNEHLTHFVHPSRPYTSDQTTFDHRPQTRPDHRLHRILSEPTPFCFPADRAIPCCAPFYILTVLTQHTLTCRPPHPRATAAHTRRPSAIRPCADFHHFECERFFVKGAETVCGSPFWFLGSNIIFASETIENAFTTGILYTISDG